MCWINVTGLIIANQIFWVLMHIQFFNLLFMWSLAGTVDAGLVDVINNDAIAPARTLAVTVRGKHCIESKFPAVQSPLYTNIRM